MCSATTTWSISPAIPTRVFFEIELYFHKTNILNKAPSCKPSVVLTSSHRYFRKRCFLLRLTHEKYILEKLGTSSQNLWTFLSRQRPGLQILIKILVGRLDEFSVFSVWYNRYNCNFVRVSSSIIRVAHFLVSQRSQLCHVVNHVPYINIINFWKNLY